MELIVSILFDIFTAIMSLLPLSPFLGMLDLVEEIPVLGIVNWFIPFDTCLVCLELWGGAMLTYLVVQNMDKIMDTWIKVKSIF